MSSFNLCNFPCNHQQPEPTKGRKITFSTITDITNEEVKYNKENPKEGSEEDRQAKIWVSVTSDGYKTMGTLKEVMEEMSLETKESKADPSTPGAAAHYPEDPHNPIDSEQNNNNNVFSLVVNKRLLS